MSNVSVIRNIVLSKIGPLPVQVVPSPSYPLLQEHKTPVLAALFMQSAFGSHEFAVHKRFAEERIRQVDRIFNLYQTESGLPPNIHSKEVLQ